MLPANVRYKRIYVWELPVRAFHWINLLAVTVLCSTGFLIGQPHTLTHAQEAIFQFNFGWIRFVHFTAAWVFTLNFAARIYWGFVGNQYASWKVFIPTSAKNLREILEVLKVDILQTRVQGPMHIGHNRLAGTIYFMTFFVFLLQVLSGFGLYSSMSQSLLARACAWVPSLVGGEFVLRQLHHAMLWFYITFTLVHIHLVFYHDYVEGRGTTSSMVGGWKFEREDYLDS